MKINADDDIVVLVSERRRRADRQVFGKGPLQGNRVELTDGNLFEIFNRVREQQRGRRRHAQDY